MSYSVSSSGEVKAETTTVDFFEQLLREDDQLKPMLDRKDSLKIQVIYTQIDRDKDNKPSFKDYYFNVNPSNYFYPASTVKMPVAMLALEKIKKLNVNGINSKTTLITGAATPSQTTVYNDPLSPDGRPSIDNYVKKVFLVSDNDAFNRLYEFLGQHELNQSLRAKGYQEAEIIHRLNISLPESDNRITNPVSFLDPVGKKLWEQPMLNNESVFFSRSDSVGKGYYRDGQLVQGAMNFSRKNRISLPALHNVLRTIMFPSSIKPEYRFDVDEQDLREVRKVMGQNPNESVFPPYPLPVYYPAYCKYLLYGADKEEAPIPGVRIFNKVGDAYGFMLDVAYVVDFERQIEFMLSAVIYCNQDGVLNDDKYDYETIGLPFMKNLGRKIYQYELTRQREHKPDLTEFKFSW
jgi:hypothetical protein